MYTQWQCILSYGNSTAMYKLLKTLHPSGIPTQDLLFCRRTRWPLCHVAMGTGHRRCLRFSNQRASFFPSSSFSPYFETVLSHSPPSWPRWADLMGFGMHCASYIHHKLASCAVIMACYRASRQPYPRLPSSCTGLLPPKSRLLSCLS
jgi:hypothetical protein